MKMTDLHLRQKAIIYLMHINQSKENNQNYVPETVAEQTRLRGARAKHCFLMVPCDLPLVLYVLNKYNDHNALCHYKKSFSI